MGLPRRLRRAHRRLARARAPTQARQRRRAHRARGGLRRGRPGAWERGMKLHRPHVRDLDLHRPLDPIPSIKLKLGFVIAAAVGATVFVFWVFLHLGVWPSVSGIIAAIVAMGLVWFLSRGLTSPLREMAAAADAMAKGDYS